MQIRKKFEIEMAHIVRNAWSDRCAKSVHGHTYNIEVVLQRHPDAETLHDDGRMVVDFGLVKKYLNPFIDSFDHAMLLWDEDDPAVIDFFRDNFDRVIVCPGSSSCEMMSAVFFVALRRIIDSVPEFQDVQLAQVVVHETRTGSATCDGWSDWVDLVEDKEIVENTWFAPEITREWPYELVQLSINGEVGSLWQDMLVKEAPLYGDCGGWEHPNTQNPCCEVDSGICGTMKYPDFPKPPSSFDVIKAICDNDMWSDFFGKRARKVDSRFPL